MPADRSVRRPRGSPTWYDMLRSQNGRRRPAAEPPAPDTATTYHNYHGFPSEALHLDPVVNVPNATGHGPPWMPPFVAPLVSIAHKHAVPEDGGHAASSDGAHVTLWWVCQTSLLRPGIS